VKARVPASSANLGPGFDTLGLALSLYTEVTVEPAKSLSLTTTGEGSNYPTTSNHFAAKLVRQVLGHDRVRITIASEIPVSRGLGSSASLALGIVAACGHPDPLSYVGLLEGHADNAAASVLGGFVTATLMSGRVIASPLPLDDSLQFVVVIPDRNLSTRDARQALPERVSLQDATFNLGRMGAVIAGLGDHRRFRPGVFDDRLHQSSRTSLFPESVEILGALTSAGAFGSFWSGAGPTLLAVTHRDSSASVRDAGEQALIRTGVSGRVLVLDPDCSGIVVSKP
jgi:homoserine kinase